MNKKHSFRAIIQDAHGGGAFVQIPFDVEQAFGSKRPKVKATIGGEPYRGTLVRMGTDYHILGILKEIRQKVGKNIGDEVDVVVEPDTDPRVVEIPAELRMALSKDAKAQAAFEKLAYSHQREYVKSISGAKKPETRARRVVQAIERLKQAKKQE
jgi:hypothetical protein